MADIIPFPERPAPLDIEALQTENALMADALITLLQADTLAEAKQIAADTLSEMSDRKEG